MHFSALTVSMLVANAAAWGNWGNSWTYNGRNHKVHTYTQVVTVGSPSFTQFTPIAGTPPAETPVAETPVVETPVADYEVPTTLVTKAYSTAAAAESTTAASSSSSSTDLTSDEKAALAAHNAARAEVGTTALTWDDTLAANAQEWATHLVSVGSLEHSSVSDQGENLYMQYSTDTPFTNAVAAFVSEKSLYAAGTLISESNYMSFGHYTQVVWKSTTKVGMAMATGSNGEVYVVARYQDPGNYLGEAAY